jgi:hypothetical protein
MDVLIRFPETRWSRMNLRMREDFLTGEGNCQQARASVVEDVFNRWDRLNLARPDVPAASQGNSFQGRFERPKAFRTRSNTKGAMQWAGQGPTPQQVPGHFTNLLIEDWIRWDKDRWEV